MAQLSDLDKSSDTDYSSSPTSDDDDKKKKKRDKEVSSAFAWQLVGAKVSAPWRVRPMVLVHLQVDMLHRRTTTLLLDLRVIQR